MESSSDEMESGPTSVSDYHFEDEDDQPASFSVLPLRPDGAGAVSGLPSPGRRLSLFGKVDNGLQKVSKQVAEWRYDLSSSAIGPVVSVLAKEGVWIALEGRPVKWYGEREARTVLVALTCLHFVRWNPEASPKTVWDHLAKAFSWFEVKPNQNDLVEQVALIAGAVKSDASLSKSKFLLAFLEEKPEKTVVYQENLPSKMEFIDDDDGDDYGYDVELEKDEASEDEDTLGSVCAICDDGGGLLCCDGPCMRSFHPSGATDSHCEGLGITEDRVKAIQDFLCKNCKYKQHQCYACRKLGVSDRSRGAEVFRCANATCGHFYHPHCIANLLQPNDDVAANELQKNIVQGESFTCTYHKCAVCQQRENRKETELQFAVCRRCPTSYHRKCLPRDIPFANRDDGDEVEDLEVAEDVAYRAWDGLLPNRVLIYCLKHEILEELGTPLRDQVIFPDLEDKKKKPVIGLPARTKTLAQKRKFPLEDSFQKKKLLKSESSVSGLEGRKLVRKEESTSDCERKVGADGALNEKKKSVSSLGAKKTGLGSRLYNYMTGNEGPEKQETTSGEPDKPDAAKISAVSKASVLDVDSKRRIYTLMKESASSVTLEDVLKKYQVPSTHASSSKSAIDQNIKLGKVEGAVEAVREAVKKLENNCSIDDAKAVCEPEVLQQIMRWQSKLKVYLAPFLHGMRYSSFGRHFTKVEKLEEIVNMLHWYVENGDMIVDFCCGANDFSWAMKKKLEETGKKCAFKNYDFFPPKNNFNFEKRDWFTVQPHELMKENRPLIMGLNPPFGVKAALANMFIDKALQFEPKLLILIVPPETERLDKKHPPYDLVWEDTRICAGKSFYLPGSVDVNEKQMEQWNQIPPVLSLWSRSDCTAKHKAIAEKKGHLSSVGHGGSTVEDSYGNEMQSHAVQDGYDEVEASMVVVDPVVGEGVTKDGQSCWKSHVEEMPKERRNDGYGKPPASNVDRTVSNYVPPQAPSGQSAVIGTPSRSFDPPQMVNENAHQPLGTRLPSSEVQHEVAYGAHPSTMQGTGASYSFGNSGRYTSEFSTSDDVFGSYLAELEREKGLQPQVDNYHQHPGSSVQPSYFAGPDVGLNPMGFPPSAPYGSFSPAPVSSYRMSMSATQRYAPQLNDMNVSRFDAFAPEPPRPIGGPFIGARPSHLNNQADSVNFAPGTQYPYPPNSAGWLND